MQKSIRIFGGGDKDNAEIRGVAFCVPFILVLYDTIFCVDSDKFF